MKALTFAFSLQFLCILFAPSAVAQTVHNRTSGIDYGNIALALAALPDGGSNVLLEVEGPVSTSATFAKNFNGLTIRGIGQPTVDCNQADSWLAFNGTGKTLQNIIVDNFRITNNNPTTSNAAALRFTTVKGANALQRLTFSGCSIPVRATTACGDFLVEDCVAIGYTSGVFRFGLGSQTGINPNTSDMGGMVFRRCKFDGTSNASTEAELVIKRMTSLLVEDCTFRNSSKYGVSVYDPAFTTGQVATIRRNHFINGHAKATSGGTIDFSPNVTTGIGTTQSLLVDSNVFDGDKGQMIQQTNGLQISIVNNTLIEGVGNAGNLITLSGCKNFLNHYNNIYVANSTNTNAMVNVGTMAYDTDQLRSDYNLYYKTTTSRGIFQGMTMGGTNAQMVNGSTLALLQAKGYDSHGMNTQPVFNTTQKKFSTYYLLSTSPGVNAALPSFMQSRGHVYGVPGQATQDIGRLTNRVRRYRLGRTRITKTS